VEAASVPWRPLGELFVSRGLITDAELETALAEQAATGKRLGEILVDSGLVSGPDLTSALMDQLGVEIAKEEGFGSGLWAEIKRRHRRVRSDDADDAAELDPEEDGQPEIALVPPWEDAEPEPEAQGEAESGPEAHLQPEPVEVPPELEEELEEIKADYQAPSEREPEPEPEAEAEPEPEPELSPAAETAQEPEIEYAPEVQPGFELAEPGADPLETDSGDKDVAALRAELDEARAELAHLQDMLADAMIALAALTAEDGAPSA